jgi:hypothetical protein
MVAWKHEYSKSSWHIASIFQVHCGGDTKMICSAPVRPLVFPHMDASCCLPPRCTAELPIYFIHNVLTTAV